jgi:5-methylthioadenosine/S-adenosylhomocysteine deaminase
MTRVRTGKPVAIAAPGSSASRRSFLATAVAGLAASCSPVQNNATGGGQAAPGDVVPDGRQRVLLRGGSVLSLDAKVGDFEQADVLIEGGKIAAVGPSLSAGDALVVDCAGTIVMPGFITTHHHQYETLMRSLIPDGLLGGDWPQESYGSTVQAVWTAGRVRDPRNPSAFVWDLGRTPFDPEDNYVAQLVASLSQISEGVTMGTDVSQANHTPEHTDAMIRALVDSGRRTLFAYSNGTDRSPEGLPFEYPGAMGDSTRGIGRLAKTFFSSRDQLVTMGLQIGAGPAAPDASYTGWQLARSFGAVITSHNVGGGAAVVAAAADARNGADWSDVTYIHATRWQDAPRAQVGRDSTGFPGRGASRAWEIVRDRGAHVSIAPLIEMQMRHGMPPFQESLNYGILPSLSPDVDSNMTTDPFSLMRGAFCLQRALANDLAFPESNPGALPVPRLVTSRQVIEMATIAGAAANRVLDKVGTLTPGKEADVVVLDARNINTWPMNNVPGTVVTMMNPRHVRHVLIAGKGVFWNGSLTGWDLEQLLRRLEQSHERVLARINAPAKVGALPKGLNSQATPYRPNRLGDCCEPAPAAGPPPYALRP